MLERSKAVVAAVLVVAALGFAGGCKEPSKADLYEPVRLDGVGPTAHQFKAGNYYISEQLTDISFKKAKEEGVKTVVNLRPDEELPGMDEKKSVESLGLAYVHVPVTDKTLNDKKTEQFIDAMKKAEEPVLVHCANGNRAAGLWAIFLAMEKDVPGPEAVALAEKAGLRPGPVKEFVEDYLKRSGKIQEAPAKSAEPVAGEKPDSLPAPAP
jgi:uncharacterized protein (TIGR01244 family)